MRNNYFAFISYKREDEEWAIWLQHELEYYHLPANLNGRSTREELDIPESFRPVFRDITELKAGKLSEQISKALSTSTNLIVICSPNCALNPDWVNKEIEEFVRVGKGRRDKYGTPIDITEHIFPFIVEGKPHAEDERLECFPRALKAISPDNNLLGGNVNEVGRDMAFIKVLAGMLPKVGFDELWNRYGKDKAEQERKEREEKEKLQIAQSRFLAEKAKQLTDKGDSYLARLLALEALPKDLDNPDRPYTPEADKALRNAVLFNNTILSDSADTSSFCYSPSERFVVSAHRREGLIKLWDVSTGAFLNSFYIMDPKNVVVSPDSNYIAIAGCGITIWDVGKKEIVPFAVNGDFSRAIAFSEDSSIIILSHKGERDFLIEMHSIQDNKIIQIYRGHTKTILDVAIRKDGNLLLSASIDHTIKLWDVLTGDCLYTYSEHTSMVNCVCFMPSGDYFVSGSYDGTIKLWSINKTVSLQTYSAHKQSVNSIIISPDGCLLASASTDGVIKLWEIQEGEWPKLITIKTIASRGKMLAGFCFNGESIIFSNLDDAICISNIKNVLCRPLFSTSNLITGVVPISVSKIIAFAEEKRLCIWDLARSKEIKSREAHDDIIWDIKYSSKKKMVVTASLDGTIKVWDSESLNCLRTIHSHSRAVWHIAFNKDESRMVSVSADKSFIIYENNFENVQCFEAIDANIWSARFNETGDNLILASDDGIVRMWDLESKKCVHMFQGEFGHTADVLYAVFGPNDKTIVSASADKTIKIWDVQSERCIQTLHGHSDSVCHLSFFEMDNRLKLLSTSEDATIKVWDFETGFCVHTFKGHEAKVHSAFFDRESNVIISSSWDGTIRSWPIFPLRQLIKETRERFAMRRLTLDEKNKYYID